MAKKPHSDSHSQTLGILWISIGLLLIALVAFFSSRQSPDTVQNDSVTDSFVQIPASHEDSLRHQRQYRHYQRKTTTPRHEQYRIDSTWYDARPAVSRQPLSVELNSADTTTLQLLHGIGPAYARRIVNYRSRLGGFIRTDQLLEVYGFTPDLLAHIAPCLTLDTSNITRISINSIPLKQLIRHPYIEYYQARDIVTLRNRGLRFHTPDDLRAVPSMADSTLQRLLPYLDFGDSSAENNSPAAQ